VARAREAELNRAAGSSSLPQLGSRAGSCEPLRPGGPSVLRRVSNGVLWPSCFTTARQGAARGRAIAGHCRQTSGSLTKSCHATAKATSSGVTTITMLVPGSCGGGFRTRRASSFNVRSRPPSFSGSCRTGANCSTGCWEPTSWVSHARYVRHFVVTLRHVLALDPAGRHPETRRPAGAVRSFPISIDSARFRALSEDAGVHVRRPPSCRGRRRRIPPRVDRLDYTKGIPNRLLAFERFLEKNPAAADSVRLIQLTIPSRGGNESYAAFRRQVEGRWAASTGTTEASMRRPSTTSTGRCPARRWSRCTRPPTSCS